MVKANRFYDAYETIRIRSTSNKKKDYKVPITDAKYAFLTKFTFLNKHHLINQVTLNQ